MERQTVAPEAEAVKGVKKGINFTDVLKRIIEDKQAVNQFFDGKLSIGELNARGIRFVKAI